MGACCSAKECRGSSIATDGHGADAINLDLQKGIEEQSAKPPPSAERDTSRDDNNLFVAQASQLRSVKEYTNV